MIRRDLLNWISNERGSSAVEFAFVGPAFLLLVIGSVYACLLLFSEASMQYAVEEGARCASVKTTVCTSSGAIIAYTNAAYNGPIISPTFTYSAQACGNAVTGSASFKFDMGLTKVTVPLSATACFP